MAQALLALLIKTKAAAIIELTAAAANKGESKLIGGAQERVAQFQCDCRVPNTDLTQLPEVEILKKGQSEAVNATEVMQSDSV